MKIPADMLLLFSRKTVAFLIVLVSCAAFNARADTIVSYEAEWSGASFGNLATASAIIDIDVNLLPDPTGDYSVDLLTDGAVTSLTLTVIGAGAGDGTFTASDFYDFLWNTDDTTLNLNEQLVGQETESGPWGDGCSYACSFDLYTSNPAAPGEAGFAFGLLTGGGSNDKLTLTSLEPVATAEPASPVLLAVGLLTLFVGTRTRLLK